MKRIIYSLLILISLSDVLYSQSINFRVSSYFYSWERADSIYTSSKTSHLKGYQNLLLEATHNKWSLHSLLQTEEDIVNKSGDGFNFRIYNLYLKGSNLLNLFDLKLGRQYVFAGTGNSAIDGIHIKLKAGKSKQYQFTGYAGALTALDYEVKKYPELNKNFAFGALFSYYGIRGMNAALSYFKRNKQMESYSALRLDSLFVTQTVEVDRDFRQDQLAGLEVNYTLQNHLNAYLKTYYDLNSGNLYRCELNGRYKIDNMDFSLSYTYRQPYIRYNSIFWVFPYEENHELEAGFDYIFKSGLNLFCKITDNIFTEDNSLRLQLGVSHMNYGISYTNQSGYGGSANGINAYYYKEIIRTLLSGNVSVNYYNYGMGKYYKERFDAFSGMLGVTLRPFPNLSFDAQGQIVTNKISKYDMRMLFGINYWLFEKF
ncbi:MAG: hypothetical protein HGGPFJEG_01600 [Ignavibacteria bacterium]|nr:hypothetical protein [Ignavibacteria bacterium]